MDEELDGVVRYYRVIQILSIRIAVPFLVPA